MIIKVNNTQQQKLEYIAKYNNVKTDDMLPQIIDGFINRFETKNGTIDSSPKKTSEPKKPNLVYRMYEYYKEFYNTSLGKEYVVEKNKKTIDMRHIKTVRNKIAATIAEGIKKDIISINDEDLLAAFKYFLNKTPEWWVKNSFAPSSLASNFEKIMNQIKNPNNETSGRRSAKNALDDYLGELTANGNTSI